MRVQVGAGELVVRLFLATLMVLASGAALLYLFAFCTLVGGGLPHGSPVWWRAVLGKLFLSLDPGWASWPLATLLLGSGALGLHALGALLGRIACDLATDFDSPSAPGPTPPAGTSPV